MRISVRFFPAARIRASVIAILLLTVAVAAPAFVRPATAVEDNKLAGQSKPDYRARRQKLMERLKDGIVVLIGAREDEFGEVGRFRQKNNFMYLTGVQTPSAYMMLIPAGIIPNKPAQEIVFIPPRNLMHEKWTGPQIGPGREAEAAFGMQEVADASKFNDRLREVLTSAAFKSDSSGAKPAAKIYTVVAKGTTAEIERESRFVESLRKLAPDAQVVDVSSFIGAMRKIKSPAEIELLQKAIDITGEAQREVARTIKPGAYEYEAQAALEAAFTRNGAERPGFPSIVGSGFYSTVLHYNENRKKIEAGDTVVVDIGAEYSYYTADITRTYPASGKFTERQRQIYQLVLDAQRAAEKAFKPGQSTMAQLNLVAINTIKASPLRDKQGNTLERYFIHGLGHWLGMDVHDEGDYSNMPVGSVFTIEPGIYIPEEKLGVRIEDDYLVTETGLIKLSRKIPCEADEVERLMSSRSKETMNDER